MSPRRLKALFYPYSRCQTPLDLKRALLLFDELYFVDPIARDIAYDNPSTIIIPDDPEHPWYRDPLSTGDMEFGGFHWPEWDRIKAAYAMLQDEGIVRIYDPKPLVAANGDLLLASYSQSRSRQDFSSAYSRMEDQQIMLWVLPESRIPKATRSEIQEVAIGFRAEPTSTTTVKVRPWMPRPKRLPEGLVALNVDDAFPLLLDQALLICEREGMIPFTDDRRAHEYLVSRYSAIEPSLDKRGSLESEPTLEDRYKFGRLALNVAGRIVSDEDLEARSFDEICRFRAASQEELTRFRDKLWQLTFELESAIYDERFRAEIKKLVETEVVPEMRRLEDRMAGVYKKLFGGLVGKVGEAALKTTAATLPTITLASIEGLSAGKVVYLAAAAFLSTFGISLPSLISFRETRREERQNFVHYLYHFVGDRVRENPAKARAGHWHTKQ